MFDRRMLIPVCAVVAILSPVGVIAGDVPATTMQPPAMPMMGQQQGGMPMMRGPQGGMPMMRGYGPRGMPMAGDAQDNAPMPGCQHRGKHMMGGGQGGMAMKQAHMQKMEQSLANIEALLQQLVDLQKR